MTPLPMCSFRPAPSRAATMRRVLPHHASTLLILFLRQQRSFAFDVPLIAAEFAVFSHHAMTRNDDRDAIRGAGASHSTRRCRLADGPRNLAVRTSLTARNPPQLFPHAPLKRRRLHIQR